MKLAVFLLEHEGHTVIKAGDAEEGIRQARENAPDLILMDVQLPRMDGLTATRLLKADPFTHSIKIVALTALAMSGDREAILAAGCDAYFAKPIRHEAFMKLVNDTLSSPPSQ